MRKIWRADFKSQLAAIGGPGNTLDMILADQKSRISTLSPDHIHHPQTITCSVNSSQLTNSLFAKESQLAPIGRPGRRRPMDMQIRVKRVGGRGNQPQIMTSLVTLDISDSSR